MLAKCSAILQNGESESGDIICDEDDEEEEDPYTACIASLSPDTLAQLANQLNNSTGNKNQPQLAAGSAALAAAACKALLFGANKKSNEDEQQLFQQQLQNEDEQLEQQRLTAANSVVAATTPTNFIVRKTINSNNSSPALTNRITTTNSAASPGGKLSATQCPECGKHLRKRKFFLCQFTNKFLARDLIAHLATIHKIAPPIQNNLLNNNNIPLISKFVTNNNDYGTTATALSELRQLRQQFTELKTNLISNKIEQVKKLL